MNIMAERVDDFDYNNLNYRIFSTWKKDPGIAHKTYHMSLFWYTVTIVNINVQPNTFDALVLDMAF